MLPVPNVLHVKYLSGADTIFCRTSFITIGKFACNKAGPLEHILILGVNNNGKGISLGVRVDCFDLNFTDFEGKQIRASRLGKTC